MSEMNNKLDQMIVLCSKAHKGQMYGNKPYTYHLHQVVNTYRNLVKVTDTEDEDIADMACMGHDLLEDTAITKEHLTDMGIPDVVVTAIDLVTKKPDVPYEEYISKIGLNELAFNVKVCDTYSNLTESLKDGNKRRIMRYTTQLQKLYDAKKF